MRLTTILCCALLICGTSCSKDTKKPTEDKEKTENKRSYDNEQKEASEDSSRDALIAEDIAAIDQAYDLMLSEDYESVIDALAKVELNASMSATTLSKAAVTHAIGLLLVINRLDELKTPQATYDVWLNDATDSYNMALTTDSETLGQYSKVFSNITDMELDEFISDAHQYYAQLYGK